MCAQSCKSVERGKQGQRVFKIGASGEAKSLFKSSAGSDHSVNNLIKKRGKGLFACRLPHASLLSRQWRPIDRPTGRIYHYHHFHHGILMGPCKHFTSTTTTSSSLQQVASITKKKKSKRFVFLHPVKKFVSFPHTSSLSRRWTRGALKEAKIEEEGGGKVA